MAEFTFLHVSGILAIVVLGLFMSAFGKVNIYSESEHAGGFFLYIFVDIFIIIIYLFLVHTVWSFI